MKILEAAKLIIKSQGIVSFSMSDIATESGYSRAGVYQLYKTKNDILFALCFHEMQQNTSALQNHDLSRLYGDFSYVLRPIYANFLKEQDQIVLDVTFKKLMTILDTFDESIHPKIKQLKIGFGWIRDERESEAIL